MRVQTKIAILLLFLAVIFGVTFLIYNHIQQRTLYLFLKQDEQQKNVIFDRLLSLKGKGPEIFSIDYTYWDDMVAFVTDYQNKQDWAKQNIDASLSVYSTNTVWIFNVNLDPAYSISNLDDATLKQFPVPKEEIKKLFAVVGNGRFCHFFINTAQGVEEIRGSTIHPTIDEERKTDPQGYFFAAKLWDKAYLDDLSQITDSTVVVIPAEEKLFFAQPISVSEARISIQRILNGPDNKPLMQVNASFKSEGAMLLKRQAREYLLLFGIFTVAVFTLIVIFIIRWTSIPLRLISKFLSSEDAGYLNKLQNNTTEFGGISRLIDKFFKQREALVKEINERKRAEEQLKTTQGQLVQSAKMASLGLLAGGVAHEINNPLTGVLNNVQLIRMMAEAKQEFTIGEFKELLGVIEESGLRCKKITQSLLDFSRASKGTFQPVSINEIIEKVISLIEHELRLENIIIQKDLKPNLPPVLGDSQLLQQAVFDLIANAEWAIQQKAAKESGLITINTDYQPEKKNVSISISDTGIGIKKENLEKIFVPFFTTKALGEGTGLGLSIVYNLIKQHNGTIAVESQEGKGSTFKIALPINEAAAGKEKIS